MKRIPKKEETELRDLISKVEVLRRGLTRNGIHLKEDPKKLMRYGNFFFNVGDVGKGLEYYEKALDECNLKDAGTFKLMMDNLLTLKGEKVGKN